MHSALGKNSDQSDNFNQQLKFYNILTTTNFNIVIGHDLNITFPFLIPGLGVLASQGVIYGTLVVHTYTLLGIF